MYYKTCGSYLHGNKAFKNQKYYYKCDTSGYHCNKRADTIRQQFEELLKSFAIAPNEAL